MKNLALIFICLCPVQLFGQENRDLTFDETDLKIIQRASEILESESDWHKQDDRECDDDIENERYSLFCALLKASIDIDGEYVHRRPGMQIIRFTLEKYENGRVVSHRLMDWNNHPETTFDEVKTVLNESIQHVSQKLGQ